MHSVFHTLESDLELIPDAFSNNSKQIEVFSALVKSNASIQYHLCSLPLQKAYVVNRDIKTTHPNAKPNN